LSGLHNKLASILASAKGSGNFYVSASPELIPPGLEINGIGRISFPLLPEQAKQIIAIAERSPFGRAENTIVDVNVRRTWQVASDQVHLSGRQWPQSLKKIVKLAVEGLGVTSPISAELYKLLLYDVGSFFVEHRDTEKSAGMFATLVITLPSRCSGGELIVRHDGQEVCLDLNNDDTAELSFAAFYADCVHEVRPVTSGYRLALIYNLVHESNGPKPAFVNPQVDLAELTHLLKAWATAQPYRESSSRPYAVRAPSEKLIVPMAHAYTPAEFQFASLKNSDAVAASILQLAASATDCEVHLALLTIEELSSVEHLDDAPRGRRRWSRDREEALDREEDLDDEGKDEGSGRGRSIGRSGGIDDDEIEEGELIERSLMVSEWRAPDGGALALPGLPFTETELCPQDTFNHLPADEQYFHEATGNEGATLERTYRRAALVIWPKKNRLNVINSGGFSVSLSYLKDLVQRWKRDGADETSALWKEAHDLSALLFTSWSALIPSNRFGMGTQHLESKAKDLLTLLIQLNNTVRIEQVLHAMSSPSIYHGTENAILISAALQLSDDQAATQLHAMIEANADALPVPCAQLLALWAGSTQYRFETNHLLPSATLLIAMLLGERAAPKPEAPPNPWARPKPFEHGLIVDVLSTVSVLKASELGNKFVSHVLASPKAFRIDACLLPAALALVKTRHKEPYVPRLVDACRDHLRTRIALRLEPPSDFTRTANVTCRCKYCTPLNDFLADPIRKEWILKAAEEHRDHVHRSIQEAVSDLDLVTVKEGSPHRLVAAKNQASYEWRVKQREEDLANLAALE
jgi:predicted 2-oxoglutarate/Fe(II)-dependent dioxygenase YbiX